MKLTAVTLLATACAGEPFNDSNLSDDAGTNSGDVDGAIVDARSSPIRRDAGRVGVADSGMGVDVPSEDKPDAGRSSDDSGAIRRADDATAEGGRESDATVMCVASECPSSSYGEKGCCLGSRTCGVVFVGLSHPCIAWR